MRYLSASDVIAIHDAEIPGADVFDFGLLESAVARPQATAGGVELYQDVHEKAAALFHSLIRSHPFVDGNKRTGVLAMVIFFNLNGYAVLVGDSELIGLAVDTAEGILDSASIAKKLAGWTRSFDWPE